MFWETTRPMMYITESVEDSRKQSMYAECWCWSRNRSNGLLTLSQVSNVGTWASYIYFYQYSFNFYSRQYIFLWREPHRLTKLFSNFKNYIIFIYIQFTRDLKLFNFQITEASKDNKMFKSPFNNKINLRYGIRRATLPWLRAVTENAVKVLGRLSPFKR